MGGPARSAIATLAIWPFWVSISWADGHVTFISPSPWQVIQRTDATRGVIEISGTAPVAGAKIVVRALNSKGVSIAQTKANIISTHSFHFNFVVPAGGWYSIVADIQDASLRSIATNEVSPVGIGEIFIAAGQSNSFNCCGQTPQRATSKLVSGGFLIGGVAPGLRWSEEIDGGPFSPPATASGGGGGPWPAFASELASRLQLPVAVIQLGCGETTSADWLPDHPLQPSPDLSKITYKPELGLWIYNGTVYPKCGADALIAGGLFQRLTTTAKLLGSFRAILWDQGESDMFNIMFTRYFAQWQVPQVPGDYFQHLTTIIHEFHQKVGRKVPWFVAQASYMGGYEVNPDTCLPNGKPAQYAAVMAPVAEDQRALAATGVAVAGPSTDLLVGIIAPGAGATYRYPGPAGKCSHFSDAGLTALGDAWAVAVWQSHLLPEMSSHHSVPR